MTTIQADGIALGFDAQAQPVMLRVGTREWALRSGDFAFRLGGEAAQVANARVAEDGLTATLHNSRGTARLQIRGGEMLRVEIEPQPGPSLANVGLSLFFPKEAEFHLPAAFNTGWRFASDMPVGDTRKFGVVYQFVLACLGSHVLRLTSRSSRRHEGVGLPPRSSAEVGRVADGFRLTYNWPTGATLCLQLFSSIEETADEYAAWMEEVFAIQPRGRAPHRPDWLWNTRLAFCVDLWRSHGEVSHTYQHVIDLMKDLQAAGAPEDTLIYLPGWNWRYDGHYPDYRPSPVLGGTDKFREMVATARRTGCHLMLHLCGPGYDPYLPAFQAMKSAATIATEKTVIPDVWVPQGEERILTWLGGRIRPFHYDSGKQMLTYVWDGDERFISFAAPPVPDRMEAYLTIGGVPASVRVTVNGRSQEAQRARLSQPEGYTFPFPFFFQPGNNAIQVDALDGAVADWSTFWYRIHDAVQMDEVWTYPIAAMNINNPVWQQWLVREIVSLVRTTGVDAIHLDTHHVGVSLWDWREPLAAMREQLPGTVFGSEVQDEQGFQTFALTQSSSLWPYIGRLHQPDPEAGRITWQHRSPISRLITRRYARVYPHLVSSFSFVPVGSVVNHEPPSLPTGAKKRATEEVLAHADELGVIPTLRVNYRDYGLDPATRAFVQARGAKRD